MSVVWRRLRRIEAIYSVDERLRNIAEVLRRESCPHESLRCDAASWLDRLARSPKALAILTSTGSGRKRDSVAPSLALDYLVQWELLGKGTAASEAVRAAWGLKSVQTVKNAWRDYKEFAKVKLNELEPTRDGFKSRTAWLAAVSADLRDIGKDRR